MTQLAILGPAWPLDGSACNAVRSTPHPDIRYGPRRRLPVPGGTKRRRGDLAPMCVQHSLGRLAAAPDPSGWKEQDSINLDTLGLQFFEQLDYISPALNLTPVYLLIQALLDPCSARPTAFGGCCQARWLRDVALEGIGSL